MQTRTLRQAAAILGSVGLIVVALAVGVQLRQRATPLDQATPTPTVAGATNSPDSSPSASPGADARTVEEAADALGRAVESSDWAALERLIGPDGWNAGFHQSGGTPDMPAGEAIAWLRSRAPGGRIVADVQERPIEMTAEGRPRAFIWSVWRDFDAYGPDRRMAEQRVQLILSQQGDRWYWKTAVFGIPLSSPTPAPTPVYRTPEEVADAVERALERRDVQLLLHLLPDHGWIARWYEQTETQAMSRLDAWNWLSSYESAHRTVEPRPIRPREAHHPRGDVYVRSLWLDFGGWAEQKADIMLGREGDRWYWTSVLLYRPPPVGPSTTHMNGYATLTAVDDRTITVRFRTIGSRCCADQSFDGTTVTLRREGTIAWSRPGGVTVSSFDETGARIGSDVWVQFRLDSRAPDGSYRLEMFSKMYPD